jgi:hypothetical protein
MRAAEDRRRGFVGAVGFATRTLSARPSSDLRMGLTRPPDQGSGCGVALLPALLPARFVQAGVTQD